MVWNFFRITKLEDDYKNRDIVDPELPKQHTCKKLVNPQRSNQNLLQSKVNIFGAVFMFLCIFHHFNTFSKIGLIIMKLYKRGLVFFVVQFRSISKKNGYGEISLWKKTSKLVCKKNRLSAVPYMKKGRKIKI